MVRRAVEGAFVCAFVALFASAGARLLASFPSSYSWTELLINYQGGFVRRGLLGEIAYDLHRIIPAQILLCGAVVGSYGFCSVVFTRLTRRTRPLAGLAFLLSPAGLLFPLNDSAAFGRKDGFILAALAATTWVCARPRRRGALLALVAGYLALGFVVETAWLFLPLSVVLVLRTCGHRLPARDRLAVCTAAALGLAACLAGTLVANRPLQDGATALERRAAIAASWSKLTPDADLDDGALLYLGMSPREGVEMALAGQGRRSTALGYLIGLVLALIPTGLALAGSRPAEAGLRSKAATAGAFAIMALTFLVGADWGRYIHLWTMHAFVFVALTRRPDPTTRALDSSALCAGATLLILYGSAWRLKHYAWNGDSALVPGSLFLLVRSTPR